MTYKRETDLSTAFAQVLQGIVTSPLPPSAIQAAKLRILDALAMAFDGWDEPAPRVAFRSVSPFDGPCTVIARNATASAADAAFVNAVASHANAQADFGGGGHPGTFVVPVALAVGEQFRRSGQDVLTAIVVGYEAAERMSRAIAAAIHLNGFRGVPTIGVFGAAASAAVLSRLDNSQFATALDFAANMAGGSFQHFAAGTMEGHIQAGFTARAGVAAAALAAAGGETWPGTLDGPNGYFDTFARGQSRDISALTVEKAELGIHSVRSKPFPTCAANEDTMLMICALQPVGIEASRIERVVLTRPATGANGCDYPGIAGDPPYRNPLQAQMSAKFTAIAAMLGKPVREFRYFRESFGDSEVEEIVRKTSLVLSSNESDYISLEVFMKDGSKIKFHSEDVADLSWNTDIEARFERLASPKLLGATRLVRECVLTLNRLPDIGTLMHLLRA